MDLHEYQAKELLKEYGVPITDFAVISKREEVIEALENFGVESAVVKVQVHAGGRGKAGGVKLAQNREEVEAAVDQLLGMTLVTPQTGTRGVTAYQLLISPLISYVEEYYIGVVIDRKRAEAILVASPEGGVEIEEVAAKTPEKILKIPLLEGGRLRSYHLVKLAKFMGWDGRVAKQGAKIARSLARAFWEKDGSLLEINPLVLTETEELIALDAKMSLDDNALFRHKKLAEAEDLTQKNPFEVRAKSHELSYVALDGEIGCMVNGAGLAMATMDIIHHCGGTPANFLDVGGSATKERVAEGFKIILSDPHVKAILINIFGGIMNCKTLSEGIIKAASEQQISVPLIVRMEGTNVEQGKKLLLNSGLAIHISDELSQAARDAVRAAEEKG